MLNFFLLVLNVVEDFVDFSSSWIFITAFDNRLIEMSWGNFLYNLIMNDFTKAGTWAREKWTSSAYHVKCLPGMWSTIYLKCHVYFGINDCSIELKPSGFENTFSVKNQHTLRGTRLHCLLRVNPFFHCKFSDVFFLVKMMCSPFSSNEDKLPEKTRISQLKQRT